MSDRLFVGIDLGTGGVRVMAVARDGTVAASASVSFGEEVLVKSRPDGHEQSPQAWWAAVRQASSAMVEQLARQSISIDRLAAVAVDGTSGTLVVLDRDGAVLRPALMYNDPRAVDEAKRLNADAGPFCEKMGYRFQASYALAKAAWVQNHEPDVRCRVARWVHQADYIVEQLTGQPAVTDFSNALKMGYDLVDDRWPAWIDASLGLAAQLPRVVAPGCPIGRMTPTAAEATGLPVGMTVVAGATDGTAAFLASGVRRPGDYNTTLGTTLVFKGMSRRICRHPQGLIYCHRLPGDVWLPGAASNVGADWISAMFPDADLPAMDAAAADRLPTDRLAYPLMRVGERFPFLAPEARGFWPPDPCESVDRYAAGLQGVAMVERLAYEVLDQTASSSGGEVFSSGGGSQSPVWMQCRADVTGRVMHRPACGQSAFGAAVLAAAGVSEYSNVSEAVEHMVRLDRSFQPDPRRTALYDSHFDRFCSALRSRGYL